MKIVNILGIKISNIKKSDLLKILPESLSGHKQHFIVTPNPEIILSAHDDEELFYILNKADISLADGFGLKIAALIMGINLERITGADLTGDLLKFARMQKLNIAVLNWEKSISTPLEIKNAILHKFPGMQILVKNIQRNGYMNDNDHNALLEIARFNPSILFVTLGAPYQEKYIFHILHKLPSVKLAIGVGGGFDFISGKMKRAPLWIRNLGMEWLWRLVQEPWRWRRIYNAIIIFPIKFILWRFILRFYYRPNVACFLYKREGDNYKVLLVERADRIGHWQIPQGGTDGEDINTAGRRELEEEINCKHFKAKASFKNIHQYEFGESMGKFEVKAMIARGYKGQRQSLFIAEFTGQDNDIKLNYWEHSNWKWADVDNLINEIYPTRRKATELFLKKFNTLIKN